MTRAGRTLGLLGACAALCACEGSIAPQAITSIHGASGNAHVAVTPVFTPAAITRAIFNPEQVHDVGALRSVTLHAEVTGVQGPAAIVEELLTPAGERYQRREETLFGGPGDTQQVDFELPVAGTFIQQKQLTGTWTARLTVAGTVVATQTFELAP